MRYSSLNIFVLSDCCGKRFMKIVNRDGESGHPCLVSLCSVKLCNVIPFVVTVATGEV